MASNETVAVFFPGNVELPSSSYAPLDERNDILVLAFPDAVDSSAEFAGFMPRGYAGGGITVTIGWMALTQTTGTVSWDVAFKSISNDADDLDSKAFASPNNVNATTASAAGELDFATVTFTDGADMDSIAAGEPFRIKITRDGDGTTSTDDITEDVQLLFVEIKET